MEALEECLFMDKVPPSWEKLAYPSLLSLAGWHADLLRRLRELESWVSEFQVELFKLIKNQNYILYILLFIVNYIINNAYLLIFCFSFRHRYG